MKPSLLIIIPLIVISHQPVKPLSTHVFIPAAYQYPEDSLLTGKYFVMQKEGDSLLNYSDKKIQITPSGKVLTEKRYSAADFDSTIYLNDKMIETYTTILNHTLIKGEILQDTLIEDGSRLGENLKKVIYHMPVFDAVISSRQQYLKDTTLVWDHHSIGCLAISSQTTIKIQSPNDTMELKALHYLHTTYYGKGWGLLRFTTRSDNTYVTFTLKEIRPLAGTGHFVSLADNNHENTDHRR